MQRLNNKGMTLVEILIALSISALVMAGAYAAFNSQQQAYVTQQDVTEMQQNLRTAIYYMTREIRMAGCDPTGFTNAGIVSADVNRLNFTEDADADGTITGDENITYDLVGMTLRRNTQTIAENIEALDFVYLDEDTNALTPYPLSSAARRQVRSVQVTLIARSEKRDQKFLNTTSYTNRQGTEILAPQNDNFRRRILSSHVKCRNFGLGQ